MLHVWQENWGFRVAECPCDLHLTDYIAERALTDRTIYHFGTGDHHHVGISQGRERQPQFGDRHHGFDRRI